MEFAIKLKKPVVIRYPRGGEPEKKFNMHFPIKYGKAEVLNFGKDVTIIGIGKTVSTAMEVAQNLKKYNINAEVINARFIKPFDKYRILESANKTKFVVTIEDGTHIGGFGASVKELKTEKAIKIKSFAYPDKFIKQGSQKEIEELYGLDAKNITEYIA